MLMARGVLDGGREGQTTSPGWQGRIWDFTASPGVWGWDGVSQAGGREEWGGDGERRSDLGGIWRAEKVDDSRAVGGEAMGVSTVCVGGPPTHSGQ